MIAGDVDLAASAELPEEERPKLAYTLRKARRNWDAARRALEPTAFILLHDTLRYRWVVEGMVDFNDLLKWLRAVAVKYPAGYFTGAYLSDFTDFSDSTMFLQKADKVNEAFMTVLMDVYTLGRMLKAQSDDKTLIIFYGGKYHAETYKDVFEALGFTQSRFYEQERACVPVSALRDALNFSGATFRASREFAGAPFLPALQQLQADLNAWLSSKHAQPGDAGGASLAPTRKRRRSKEVIVIDDGKEVIELDGGAVLRGGYAEPRLGVQKV